MISVEPKYLCIVGFILMLLGAGLPFLMVLQIIPSTFFLNFFSFGAGFVGLILGMIGAMTIALRNRKRNRD